FQAEDGIRGGHVTGVQTCALPISCYDFAHREMKICFFHLMPYRFLPEDFERRYRSVWVDPPHSLFDPEKCGGLYHEFLDELEFRSEERRVGKERGVGW